MSAEEKGNGQTATLPIKPQRSKTTKKRKPQSQKAGQRVYQCPHCPSEPPYAGASGLWYHMKRHHGAVTRPYQKKNKAKKKKATNSVPGSRNRNAGKGRKRSRENMEVDETTSRCESKFCLSTEDMQKLAVHEGASALIVLASVAQYTENMKNKGAVWVMTSASGMGTPKKQVVDRASMSLSPSTERSPASTRRRVDFVC